MSGKHFLERPCAMCGPTPRPLAERLREASNSDEWPELDFGEVVSPDLLREAADALDAYERLAEAVRAFVEAKRGADINRPVILNFGSLVTALAILDDLRRSQKETR